MSSTKHILITGVSPGGIGYHCAMQLLQQGHKVVGTLRNHEQADLLAQQGLDTVFMEMLDYQSIEAGYAAALELLDGRVDVLIQNAGFGQAGFVEDLPVAALEEQFKVNLFALHHLNSLVIPLMRQQGQGRILVHSSVLGFVGMACRGAYVASKFALEGLVQAMRVEMHNSGIDLCLLNTGPVSSRFRTHALRALLKYVDTQNSVNHQRYSQAVLPRLNAPEETAKGNYSPEYVFKAVEHAINAPRPKTNYYITPPTKALYWLHKILPRRQLDGILRLVDR